MMERYAVVRSYQTHLSYMSDWGANRANCVADCGFVDPVCQNPETYQKERERVEEQRSASLARVRRVDP